ncbi:MAG: DUF3137 domain-containing protein [Alphaproteobacteria bacterium]
MNSEQLNALNEELQSNFKKAHLGKRLVNWFKIPVYLSAFVFVIMIVFNTVTGASVQKNVSSNNFQYIMLIPIGVMVAFQMLYVPALIKFSKLETETIQKIIKKIFPRARYYTGIEHSINERYIAYSKLFPGFGKEMMESCGTFGSIKIDTDSSKLSIYDVGVSFGKTKALIKSNNITGYFMFLYTAFLKPVFSNRIESSIFDFRGMFTHASLTQNINANVLIFPDHLDEKLGYLADNIHAMRTVYKNKLVKLEDPEFERVYVVYSDDEIATRKVLTPLMMRKLTDLRNKFGRDIMLSFCDSSFYFAVSMPEGFLTLRIQNKQDENIVAEIYEDIVAAINILDELNLKQIK